MLAAALLSATPAGAVMAGSASGNPPDSPADRVDANTTDLDLGGVGQPQRGRQ